MSLELQLLGRLELRDGARGEIESVLKRPKRLAILAYLCLAGSEGSVRRDTLLSLFWPDSDEARARSALNQALHVLRRSLGEGVLVTRGRDEIRVDIDLLRCDAGEFRRALAAGDPASALDLYSGDLLPGFHLNDPEFERWLDAERVALRSEALEAALSLATGATATGRSEAALAYWRRALEISPESEAAARGLIEALWCGGRRTAALETHEHFESRLYTEYGLAPGDKLQQLIARIRTGEDPATPAGPGAQDRLPSVTPAEREASPVVREPAGHLRGAAWVRVALTAALGILIVTLLGMWLDRSGSTHDARPEEFDAQVAYRQAFAAWELARYDSALLYVRKAIAADSSHADAWALLSNVHTLRGGYGLAPPREELPLAYAAAQRAVALDSANAGAWLQLAMTQWGYLFDWTAAERGYREALELGLEGTWAVIAYADLSGLLFEMGRCEEAFEIIRPAAALDSVSLLGGLYVRSLYYCGDYEEAIREADRQVRLGERYPAAEILAFFSYLELGRLGDAADAVEAIERRWPGDPRHDVLRAHLAIRMGDLESAKSYRARAEREAENWNYGRAGRWDVEERIRLHAALGEINEAFDLIQRGTDERGHVRRLASDPLLAPLWEDPRYEGFLARMNLRCRRFPDGGRACHQID